MSARLANSESNIVREVVARSLCCGCGVCAALCPERALEMRFNIRGELVPVLLGDCARCQLCLRVCPALEVGAPLPSDQLFGSSSLTRQDPHLGRFVEAFVGYSLRHRDRAASGGMTTWTLQELLRRKEIDAAACVRRSHKSDRLFEAALVSTPTDLLAASSSKYYPVEFSSVLEHILQNDARFAIVALPCAVTAIRKAQRAVPLLRKRIRYLFALACGHGVSKHFTRFLLTLLGLSEEVTRNVDYRYARLSRTASNFAFRAQKMSGEWSRPLFFDGLYGRLWAGRFFVPKACDFCDDLFAPLADATFMDAWLPQYDADPRGTSIAVVRQPELAGLFAKGREEGSCHFRPIPIEHVRQSQGAALTYKTVYLPLRVARAERDGLVIPRSFPRSPLPGGVREKLAGIKHAIHDRACRGAFDPTGLPRAAWVSLLTAYLRGQWLWRTARRVPYRVKERIIRQRRKGSPCSAIGAKKKRKMHFLLVGHAGFWNRGCEAILDTTFRLLREQFGNPTFTVVSFDWANDRLHGKAWKDVTFRSINPERWRSPHWYLRLARRLLHLPAGDWRTMHKHLRREYRKADAVLSVGGDNYTTDYSPFPGYYLDVLRYAREQGTKGVIWAASVGPFDDPGVRKKVVAVLKDTPLITAREPLTIEYLTSLGITTNVRAVADPAFLLEPLPSPAALSYSVSGDRKWLGICVSSMLWRYISDGEQRDRSDVLVKFIDWAVEELGFSVLLVPHVVDTRPAAPVDRNDHLFLTRIRERVKRRDTTALVAPSLRASEIKYLITQCRFFIGSRTHSTISALSSGVPTISLSYSMKSRGINRDVLGSEDFVLPISDLSLGRLKEAFGQLLRREDEIRAVLQQRLPTIKDRARKNAQYLAELLGLEDSGERGYGCES